MSLIDVLDENGKPTGDKKTKPEIHLLGLWHKAAHVWIYNSKGEMLLQKRSKNKDDHPGELDIAAAGHVDSGETAQEAALREAKEELCLNINLDDLKEIGVRKVSKYNPANSWQNNEIDYVYILKFDGDISDLTFSDGEVEGLVWISLDKLEKEIVNTNEKKKYVNHGDYYNFVIDAIKNRMEDR